MNYVDIKHENSDKLYTFKNNIGASIGETVVVSTKKGLQVGQVVKLVNEREGITGEVVAKVNMEYWNKLQLQKEHMGVLKSIKNECLNKGMSCADCPYSGANCMLRGLPYKWKLSDEV